MIDAQETSHTNVAVTQAFCNEINEIDDAHEILFRLFKTFKNRSAIVTSGQITGTTLIHLAHENGIPFRVCTIDTLRLFSETYQFLETLEDRYQIEIERIKPKSDRLRRMIDQHGEYLFFDSKAKQEYCCAVRKVRPMDTLLKTIDVWISGLRRDQSENRQATPKAEIIDRVGKRILKVNPLVDWSDDQIREFMSENGVPINPLLLPQPNDHVYESIGCVICTTPIRPGETKRSGRWRWQNVLESDDKKECGLHFAI